MEKLKRTNFRIRIQTIYPSSHKKEGFRWRTISGKYKWELIDKKTDEVIAEGECIGKHIAREKANTIIKGIVNFNPSDRNDRIIEGKIVW